MARESSAIAGSGISALREGLVHNSKGPVPAIRGTNAVIANYEDVNSMLAIQSSGLVVSADAVHVSGPGTRLRGRRQLKIQNLGGSAAYIGSSSGVTTTTGVEIASGDLMTLNLLDVADVYIISAGTSDVRVLELK